MDGKHKQDGVLFHYRSSLKIGNVDRYIITYDLLDDDNIPSNLSLDPFWLRIKNNEPISYRAAYLMGPYVLYCDVKTGDYTHSRKIYATADQPQFQSNLQPQQYMITELSFHKIRRQYTWIVDVISQVLFSVYTSVSYDITLGRKRHLLDTSLDVDCVPDLRTYDTRLKINRLNTLDLWNLPVQIGDPKKKKHLVVLTHGLHSNVTADLMYIQEQIYKTQDKFPNEQLVVKGFTKNVCHTEMGIKYLGSRCAEYIVNELYDDSIVKISFIGHSLGGLVQTFTIAYLSAKYPWFFQRVKPVNFITLASPLLGIVTDNPAYVNIALSFGVIGKTGLDLGLQKQTSGEKPLLYLLPGEPVRSVLASFKRRTIYANSINDGVVPLYSAALLFVDYDDILRELRRDNVKNEAILVEQKNNFLSDYFFSPLTKMFSVLAPQKFPQAAEQKSKLPKQSMLEIASSILLPPEPDKNYIMDPSSRKSVIIHDKVYTEADIPQGTEDEQLEGFLKSKNILLRAFSVESAEKKKYQLLEEAIARRWHRGLSWRKVVVALEPDAHNNMIVRRRFTNAHGWPVIDHLIDNHFSGGDDDDGDESIGASVEGIDTSDTDLKVGVANDENIWIVKPDIPRLFDQGPTGMISTMNDMFEVVKESYSPNVSNAPSVAVVEEDEVEKFEENNEDLYFL